MEQGKKKFDVKNFFLGVNGVLEFIIFASIMLQILCREVFAVPVSWTDDWCRVVYACVVFLGATLGLREEGAHITVDIVIMLLRPRPKQIMKIIACFLMLPIIVTFTIGAFQSTVLYWNSVITTILWLRRGWLYLFIAICGCFMFIFTIMNAVDAIKALQKKPETAAQTK